MKPFRDWDLAMRVQARTDATITVKPSYDDIQLAAVRLTCAGCGAQRDCTVPRQPFICVWCQDWMVKAAAAATAAREARQ